MKHDGAAGDVGADALQTGDDLLLLRLADDALLGQHGHMRDAAIDIFIVHTLIEKNGCIVILYQFVHILFEATAP